jgi:SAM-dependent methyltransferase
MFQLLKKRIKEGLFDILVPSRFYWEQKGYCPCCDQEVIFKAQNSWLRDYFECSNCYSIPRERALMVTIEKYYPNWRDLKIHECSPGNRGASVKMRKSCLAYTETQFLPDHPKGYVVAGIRNEDLENQTFQDATFDLVITQDVMEHIYNPARAFSEIARTLKKGGAHIFTVPLINHHQPSEVWAVKGKDGAPVFLKEPEWHGNPIDQKGSPVTMHWGFDIVAFIQQHSRLQTTIEYLDNPEMGIRAEFIEVLVSRK